MLRTFNLAVCASVALVSAASAGRVVVNNDEWTLSDTGYANAPDAATFALNVANYLTGGSGDILVYSNNFGLTGGLLQATLLGAGYTVTYSTAATFDAALLAPYEAVFLGGTYPASTAALLPYVGGGGGVYIAAGTGVGGAAAEAAAWNGFLNLVDLGLAPSYNGIGGNLPTSFAHPIFAGVNQLFFNNGNTVLDLSAAPLGQVFGDGLFGIADVAIIETPAPAMLMLFGFGFAATGVARRR